jgi:integrase
MSRKSAGSRDGIYKRDDRVGFWITWLDASGRRRRRKTDAQNITQAKQFRAAEMLKAEQARILGHSPPGDESFSEVAERFLKYQKARLTLKAYDREAGIVRNHLIPHFNRPVAGIRRQDIQRYVTDRSSEVSGYSVQKELNVLKHLLRLAVEWEILPLNPAQGVKSPKVPAGRVRYLQPKELQTLLMACPDWLRPIVALLVCTGTRRGEILKLRWVDVDLSNNRLLLPHTKNGEGRIVYLNQSAMVVFGSIEQSPAANQLDLIFPDVTPENVSVSFSRVCRSLGIENFRLHDLRHTAASWLRMSGADIHTVSQLLGHKDLRMAARYQHLSPEFLAEAVGRLDDVYGIYRHQGVTKEKALTGEIPISALK